MKKLKDFVFAVFLLLSFAQSFAQTVTDYLLENLQATDTYMRNSLPNNSFGTDPNLVTGGWGDYYYTAIKFNISSLPILSSGDKASIWLYNKSPGGTAQPTAVNMGPLATDFTNNTTWNQGVSYYNQTPWLRQVNVNPYNQWTEFDITDYYNWWRGFPNQNFGFILMPVNYNNNFNFFQSSNTSTVVGQKPLLRITKAATAINLKWPLSTAYSSRVVTQPFGADWSTGIKCPSSTGLVKKHNGTDYRAAVGTLVYAADSGIVKATFSSSPWASVITIEHTKVDGSKYTTNYWHVNPYVVVGAQLTKGDLIAEVANIGSDTHFHFTIRDAPYLVNSNGKNVSSVGSLPQTNCDGWPAFPEKFIDPESSSVKFQ